MPDFILDYGTPEGARAFNNLDAFTQGYVEAMFFTDTGTLDDEADGLASASVADLHPETVTAIVADCAAWQAANEALLDEAYERSYDMEQAGRDYWFTRNGHGVGFWDRDELQVEGLGDRLTAACQHRPKYLYRGDDEFIYLE